MRLLLFILFTVFTLQSLSAQVLKATVNVDFTHLPDDQQGNLLQLETKIEQYLNGYSWVEDEYETDVNCNVQVIIETLQKKTHEKIYRAQFLISSESGEKFYDKTWEFTYESSFPLNHTKGQFDPLTYFLDYYAYLILAGELDTYALLLGTPLYEIALDIANQAMMSQFPRGWSTRIDELQQITSIRARSLREIKPDFFEAMYLLAEGKKAEAGKFADKVFEGIEKTAKAQPNNRYLWSFFESHYRELAQLFDGQNQRLGLLTEYDSRHRETYREKIK
jgi:hypothetical protein